MDRWTGRVALVTGASSGIGAAIAKELVLKGMKVVGVARRVEKIEALNDELQGASGKLYSLACDITKEEDVVAVFEWATNNLGGVDVLVNNAGIFRADSLTAGVTKQWQLIMNTNIIGLSVATREAFKSMKSRGVDDGHIIHINSVSGHKVTPLVPDLGMYTASKYGVTALTEAMRFELVSQKSKIRITSISPGAVRTEILLAANLASRQKLFEEQPILEPKDIADTVLYVLGAPAHVQIHELTIKPVGEVAF